MKQVIVLDSGPLGMVTNPQATGETKACTRWLQAQLSKGMTFFVPEIADYEVRRELLRANKKEGIQRLDQLQQTIRYLPITTEAMRQAAEFWATVRKQGKHTADDKALDGDVILAAQVVLLKDKGLEGIIATTNVKHLSLFAQAKIWSDIK